MKKIFIFNILALLLGAVGLKAQNCGCFDIYLEPTNNGCCYDVTLFLRDSTCKNLYNQVSLELSDPVNTQIFDFSALPGVTVSQAGNTVTYTSASNFSDYLEFQKIGQICAGSNQYFFSFTATFTGPGSQPCTTFAATDSPCTLNSYYTNFAKVCGDSAANIPTKIKALGGKLYVAGTRTVLGQRYATFSQYENTGALNWTIQFQQSTLIQDFIDNAAGDQFFLVGNTEPFQIGSAPQNNQSFMAKVDINGNQLFSRSYAQTGREQFSRIIRHPTPINPDFPYYILGSKNPPSSPTPPSATDKVFLLNMKDDGTIGCSNEYDLSGPDDEEFHRGIIPLTNGNLYLTGNETIANDGVMILVNGQNCQVLDAFKFPAVLDIYDGVELGTNEIIIVGADFGNQVPFIAKLGSNLVPISALRMSNALDFRELGIDRVGNLFTLGVEKTGAKRNFMYNFDLGSQGGPLSYFNYARGLFNGETAFTQGKFSVNATTDHIFYADGRLASSGGFGNFDMVVGSFDMDMTTDCRDQFSDVATPFSFSRVPTNATSTPFTLPTPTTIPQTSITYGCKEFCSSTPDTCHANIIIQPIGHCADIVVSAVGDGVAPLSYQWNFGGTNQTEFLALPCQYFLPQVCVTITDANGCTATNCQAYFFPPEQIPPTINCPPSGTYNTSPGLCGANLNLAATATDNCDPNPLISYSLSSGGASPNTFYPLGQTTLVATAIDCSGNTASCSSIINVVDNQPPVIVCPPGKTVNTQICNGGAVVTFGAPTVTDNCPGVTYSCGHQSGEFFDCGVTNISCTATDAHGLTSSCSFPIAVNCTCGAIASATLECTEDPYLYNFTIQVQDQSGAASCSLGITGPPSMSNLNIGTFSGGMATITGSVMVTDPIPASLHFNVTMTCVCATGTQISCDLGADIATICCKKIEVADQQVCADAASFDVSVVTPTLGTLNNISRVQWFIKPKTTAGVCPTAPWGGRPYQDNLSSTLTDLHLYPNFLPGDICYYVVVTLNDGPCTQITSNIACVNLCESTICSVAKQEFCYTGTPITPSLMTLNITQDEPQCIQSWFWISPLDVPLQTGGATYLPTQHLVPSNPTVDCYEDFVYTVVLNDDCGQHYCDAVVRIYNDAAPKGEIKMDPYEMQPFCPGEDATLVFEKGCVKPSDRWTWSISNDGINYAPMAGAGEHNTLWQTNRLYADTWYAVESTNGVCQSHTVNYFIDVRDHLTVNGFSASYAPACAPTGVTMQVIFNPDTSSCNVTVDWYKDGILVGSTPSATSPAVFTYTPPFGQPIAGNYYCIVKNDCCQEQVKSSVKVIAPPPFVEIAGPCYRCNNMEVTLSAVLFNLNAADVCAYQWTTTDGYIAGPTTGSSIHVWCAGTYNLSVTTCDGCVLTAVFTLIQCANNGLSCGPVVWACNTSVQEKTGALPGFTLQPNPTPGMLNLDFQTLPETGVLLKVFDLNGRNLMEKSVAQGTKDVDLDVNALPSGAYLLQIQDENGNSTGRIFVKE